MIHRAAFLFFFLSLLLLSALPCAAQTVDSPARRQFVLATINATTKHFRWGTPVRLNRDTFPFHDLYLFSRIEGWRADTEMLAAYNDLRRAVRRRTVEIEPFEYFVDALTRQATRGDTVATADLIALLKGSDGYFTEIIQESVNSVFARRPVAVIRAWCARPPEIELVVGDERAVARTRRKVERLVTRGLVSEPCATRFLRAVSTW